MDFLQIIILAAIGGYGTFLANRGISSMQHVIRGNYPSYNEGKITRRDLFAVAKEAGLPLLIGMLIPLSFTTTFASTFLILILADMIGTYFKSRIQYTLISTLIGAVMGGAISAAQQALFVYVPGLLASDFITNLNTIYSPLIIAFGIIPAIAIGIEKGPRKAIAASAIIAIVYVLCVKFNTISIANGQFTPSLISFVVGVLCYVILTINKKSSDNEQQFIKDKSTEQMKKMKKNIFIMLPMGALLALGAYYGYVATDPLSHILLSQGLSVSAGFVMIMAIFFSLPMIITSTSVSGTYSTIGLGFSIVIGYFCTFIPVAYGNFIVPILGALIMFGEIYLIPILAKFLDKRAAFQKMFVNIRSAGLVVIEVAAFVGAMIVGNTLYPLLGYIVILAVYVISRSMKDKKINQAMISPAAFFIFGILLNALIWLNLL